MLPSSVFVTALLGLALPACAFDPSGAAIDPPGAGDPAASLDEEIDPSRTVDQPGSKVYVSDGESTKRGTLIAGSYVDSHHLDGIAEQIDAEIHKGGEELEHTWTVAEIPAGTYTMRLAALPYSPNMEDSYFVEYATLYEGGHTEVLILESSDEVVHYEGQLDITQPTSLDVRVKLPKRTDIDQAPERHLLVDYLALAPSP